jgi:hypothetical protein
MRISNDKNKIHPPLDFQRMPSYIKTVRRKPLQFIKGAGVICDNKIAFTNRAGSLERRTGATRLTQAKFSDL